MSLAAGIVGEGAVEAAFMDSYSTRSHSRYSWLIRKMYVFFILDKNRI
ncbi:MAG: hypothetical protein V7727_03335 [Sneathiella sp.]